MTQRPPYLSIAILSASALAYEILLMRLFSIIQWHHFAYMVIALALLGYGISGSLLYPAQSAVVRHYTRLYPLAILLFALSSLGAFLAAQSLSFNIEELFWDYRQIVNLVLIFLLLALPFAFAAGAICMTFMVFPGLRVSRIYAADLLGAGLGAVAIIFVMHLLMPEKILPVISLTGVAAAAVSAAELKLSSRRSLFAATAALAVILLAGSPYISLIYSPYKGLMQTLQVKGARILDQYASPLGQLTVVASEEMPLRHAPGLSLANTTEPLEQLGLFTDADNLSAITRYPDATESLGYLDQTTSALAYHLRPPSRLLVIGSGTGSDLLLARYHQTPSVDALELNPQLIDLLNNDYKAFAGTVYDNPHTRVRIAEARDFLSSTQQRYDVIQIALIDAANASSSGLYALNESYLYTREALQLYLSRLAPDGYLSITRWIKTPPRDMLKLFATAYQALASLHESDIDRRLVLIRNWQTGTLLIKNGLFSDPELDRVDRFCQQRLFDQAYTHRLTEAQANRYNLLSEPVFYRAGRQIVSNRLEALIDSYKFNLRPATDDRPYFHHFFKWESFVEAFRLRDSGGMPLIEWGYIVLVLTLGLTAVLSALLIILPLRFTVHETAASGPGVSRWLVLLYFFAIGLAFLFIEIAVIQRFLLFLHHPIYAISMSLTAFLIFAGLGSLTCERLSGRYAQKRIAAQAVTAIILLGVGYLFLLGPLFNLLGHIPMALKMIISILLIAPLAFFMGMPFPLAIASMKQQAADLIPWAWGVNGYASVISAGTATLIAIHFGFSAVILCALILYAGALTVFPQKSQ
ncbi:MAG: SAM-dependent methyltransferase [Candidatus Thiodiazotropha sp. (ex Epidulcina cf. delphinae)]|nr:SAM-dependent methyltransferase [Candidatus Thiodiazotropha sp. (ex Epidulcina cf. delphinae)]